MIALLAGTLLEQEAYIRAGFGEKAFHNQTTLHPVGLLALVVLLLAVLVVRRRHALVPVLVMAALIPHSQRVVIASLDFTFMRLLFLAGFARILMRGEHAGLRPRPLDGWILAWVGFSTLAWVALRGEASALVFRAGASLDVLGAYGLARCWIRSWEDLERALRTLAWISLPVALVFLVEHATARNMFSVFGGVSPLTAAREGRLRCQGPYPHPILAGCFWAVLVPLFGALWASRRARVLGLVSAASALSIVYFSSSSTPVLAVAATLFACGLWVLRRNMRAVRWATLALLVFLHFAREKPVWHLVSRVNIVGGSTGYHRFQLVDAAIRNFREWAVLGVESTAHWGFYLFDVANQYVNEAVSGGLLGLLAFLATLGAAFGAAGRVRRRHAGARAPALLAWSLGASLLGFVALFMAVTVTYAPQNLTLFLFVIGALASLDAESARAPRTAPARAAPPMAPRRVRRMTYSPT